MNTFGDASQQFPLYDSRDEREHRARFRREAMSSLERANSMYCTSGRWPSRGWILMARSDYDKLDKYSTTLQLNIGDTRQANNVSTLKNLSIIQARCVTRGLASDPNALYLIEITDGRGVLFNKWFQFPATSAYNIRAPGYPQTFHTLSMNGGTTWTWATMLEDIWTSMSTFLGPWPGLPSGGDPIGTPEGWWFSGVPAFKALCDILDHIGMTIACNLQSTTPFTIVKQNAADAAYTALVTKYLPFLEEDLEWLDTGAGRLPSTVKVLFRRRGTVYGEEETVRYDSLQWDMTSYYVISVAAPSEFSSAVGTHHIWSDYTIRFDQDGNPLADDVTTATAIAQDRVTQYFSHINPAAYTTRTYSGALPFSTGSLVDGVCWYMDHRYDRAGWRTQVVYGPEPPWPEIHDIYEGRD